jgi:hypothetical protein
MQLLEKCIMQPPFRFGAIKLLVNNQTTIPDSLSILKNLLIVNTLYHNNLGVSYKFASLRAFFSLLKQRST